MVRTQVWWAPISRYQISVSILPSPPIVYLTMYFKAWLGGQECSERERRVCSSNHLRYRWPDWCCVSVCVCVWAQQVCVGLLWSCIALSFVHHGIKWNVKQTDLRLVILCASWRILWGWGLVSLTDHRLMFWNDSLIFLLASWLMYWLTDRLGRTGKSTSNVEDPDSTPGWAIQWLKKMVF